MSNRRLQVFISSTIADLAEAREAVDRSLTALEIFDVIRSETLPAREDPSRRVCLDEVGTSDAVLLLVGRNYGYIPSQDNPEGLSVTHLELRQARASHIPVFAFPERLPPDVQRDPKVEHLLTEVEDFHSGLFRKAWSTPKDLGLEVRRSLLFWLARRVRAGETTPADLATVQRILHDAITLPTVLQTHAEGGDWRAWIAVQIAALNARAQRLTLPTIQVIDAPTDVAHISVDIDEADATHATLSLSVRMPGETFALSPADSTPEPTPPIRLRLRRNASGTRAFSSVLLGLMRWQTDDRAAAEYTLSEAEGLPHIPKQARANLLGVAMWMSAGSGTVVSLGERLASLNWLDEMTFVVATRALQILRHGENVVAGEPDTLLSRRANAVAIQLGTTALATQAAGPEAVYSLAKDVGFLHREGALRLLMAVRDLEPDYDRRWYWHRDVGQKFYEGGRLARAAPFYDRACELKKDNAELWRWGGDAFYFQGHWGAALERYEIAVRQDSYEVYFLKEKIAFCRYALAKRRGDRKPVREQLASVAADWGARLLNRRPKSRLGRELARAAARLDPLNREARAALALAANRQGNYGAAIKWLKETLACEPSRAQTRLNLCVNYIFQAEGRWTPEAEWQAQAAVALRGLSAGLQLSILLTYTRNREDLLAEFEDRIVPMARRDWEAHLTLRQRVLAPERFGTVVHIEGPDKLPPA